MLKVLTLPLMLGAYIILLSTVVIAQMNGGWVVVMVNRYHEGMAEATFLLAMLPPATYVTIKETASELKKMRRKKRATP